MQTTKLVFYYELLRTSRVDPEFITALQHAYSDLINGKERAMDTFYDTYRSSSGHLVVPMAYDADEKETWILSSSLIANTVAVPLLHMCGREIGGVAMFPCHPSYIDRTWYKDAPGGEPTRQIMRKLMCIEE